MRGDRNKHRQAARRISRIRSRKRQPL